MVGRVGGGGLKICGAFDTCCERRPRPVPHRNPSGADDRTRRSREVKLCRPRCLSGAGWPNGRLHESAAQSRRVTELARSRKSRKSSIARSGVVTERMGDYSVVPLVLATFKLCAELKFVKTLEKSFG